MRKRPLIAALAAGPCLACGGTKPPSWIIVSPCRFYHHTYHTYNLPLSPSRPSPPFSVKPLFLSRYHSPSSQGPYHCRLFATSSQNPSNAHTTTTVGTALASAISIFREQGVPEAEKSAEYLLLHAINLSQPNPAPSPLRLPRPSQPLDPATMERFQALCARRLKREPVQYIVGDWDFHLINLEMRPPMLIPRPETEELVEVVLHRIVETKGKQTPLRLLDIGAGTGAIGLALLAALPQAECVGVDVNSKAVDLSNDNAKRLGLQGRYRCLHVGAEDLLGAVEAGSIDLIVSNPPYIPEADMAGLEPEVKDYEDRGALCGGDDGGDVIRSILKVAPKLLSFEGLREVWMEVDVSHPERVEEWLPPRVRLVKWCRDMAGRPRFCQFQVVEKGNER